MTLPKTSRLFILLLFVGIVLVPVVFMFVSPFLSKAQVHNVIFSHRHLSLALNSLLLAIGTTALSLVIGVPFAFLVFRTNLFAKRPLSILYLVPILIPPYIHAIVWGRLSTPIARLFSFQIHSLPGAIMVLSLAYFPFITLMTISGLKSTDRNKEEASLLCNGSFKTIKGVTLPLCIHHILSGALFVCIFSLIDFGVPDILRVRVYAVEIFIQFGALYNEKAAAVLSVPLVVFTFILIILQKWHMKDRSYVELGGGKGGRLIYDLGRYHPIAFIFCMGIITLSVFIPIAVLLKEAGALANYLRVLTTSLNQIGYSLMIAAIGGLAALFLAFPISYMIERSEGPGLHLLEFLSLIPFAIPAATLGIGLIKVWNRPILDVVYTSSLIIILGYVAHFIPFSIRVVCSGIKQISPHLEEAALLTTGSWTRMTKKILIPLSMPSLLAGFFIAFILSLGDLGTTLLIIPPGKETIPIKIYNLMHYGAHQMVAALCLLLIALTLISSGVLFAFYKSFWGGFDVTG